MFNDEGVRSQNQIQGVDTQGNLKNIKVGDNGEILVKNVEESEETGIKVEKTIRCNNTLVGTVTTNINVNKYVTQVKIANYSETATLSITINGETYTVGSSIVVELKINADVTDIGITASEDNTRIQYSIESEE